MPATFTTPISTSSALATPALDCLPTGGTEHPYSARFPSSSSELPFGRALVGRETIERREAGRPGERRKAGWPGEVAA